MLKRVLITNHVPEEHLAPLAGLAEIIMGPAGGPLMPRAEVLRLAPELDAIINQAELRVDAELLDAAGRLKIIASVSIGTDHLDLPLLTQRGIWATNVPDAFVESVADCGLALLLNLARRIRAADAYVRSGRWAGDGFRPGVWDGLLLSGKTIGIVGFGKIGQAVARRAEAFGMRVVFHNRSGAGDPRYRELDGLLAESDVVSLHAPLLPSTRGLFDARRFSLMKPGAILINLSRGGLVQDRALLEALKSGRLAGAGLDVFENEPNPDPEFLTLENVILTPHIGGGTRGKPSPGPARPARKTWPSS